MSDNAPPANQNQPGPATPETHEQATARLQAAEDAAEKKAAADEKARLKKHREEESGNWVTVKKGEEVLEINKATLNAHKAAGWKEV